MRALVLCSSHILLLRLGTLPAPAISLDELGSIGIFQSVTAIQSIALCYSGLKVTPDARFYVEKEEPQPQDLVEWGLMKLKAWRMRVSS